MLVHSDYSYALCFAIKWEIYLSARRINDLQFRMRPDGAPLAISAYPVFSITYSVTDATGTHVAKATIRGLGSPPA